ncbi:MAG TPA: M14 family zinc carboxypeptidase [Abditibacteriaceae bacterium]|nr:M14 family zinc carboxypeptidase [Abditibacteriaceae bacterium]
METIHTNRSLAVLLVFATIATHFSSLHGQDASHGEVLDGRAPAAQNALPASPKAPLESSETFGRSVQGEPLWAHVLGEGPEVTLIFAAVHGNETATPYLVEQLRLHLKRHPGWLLNRRVVLVPVLNPDGLKVRRRVNAHGVDINRNYPGTWRRPRRGERFRPGTHPASEPETQAMIRLTNKYRPHKIVSIHQPLHCLAYTGERSRRLARAIAQENGYRILDNIGYPTPGGFGAYCDLILETAVVTLELPWQNPQAAWRRNARALLAAIALPQPRG